MAITQQQIRNAEARQHAAAHDPGPQVRLVAGPGSGKSFAIQERVRWLIATRIPPEAVFVISFTRASSRDLRERIQCYCQNNGQTNADQVNVSTLHSLALRALRAAGLLPYPADPLVMDNWELENILDKEFSSASGYRPGQPGVGYTPGRSKQIRQDYDAFCGTGQWVPPSHIPPDPPITDVERTAYTAFRTPRTQIYSCVLPGEIVRECVVNIAAGVLDPVNLLRIQDLEFVDRVIAEGATTFVAGDDDQSIYSFRFASPQGIQSFMQRYQTAGNHELTDCFRCTPNVLSAAQTLMAAFSEPNRIPKSLTSLYTAAQPPESGIVHRWRFPSSIHEARSIAHSCVSLINDGLPSQEILILVSNTRAQLPVLLQELEAADVDFESPRAESFVNTNVGRLAFALLRVACDTNDYVAHRLILGLLPRVGPTICNGIVEAVIRNNVNFRNLFYQPLPHAMFTSQQRSALDGARNICARISAWSPADTLTLRSADIHYILLNVFGLQTAQDWLIKTATLPADITLEELRDYLWADTDEQRASLLEAVYTRLGLSIPAAGFLPDKVRIMTMHGSKGLSAGLVFIPGLMDEILPGTRRRPYPGLVLEAARMLYVSISRARAACILSFAHNRVVYGRPSRQAPSQFAPHLGGPFNCRNTGLTIPESQQVVESYRRL